MKKKSNKQLLDDVSKIMGPYLTGDKYTESERYEKSIETIYQKLRPIWVSECKDALWLMQDNYIHEVAEILYLDDQVGGNLSVDSLSDARQNLLAWKQVQNVIERYKALNYNLVDDNTTKAILSGIIKNKNARDTDRLKAIEMYKSLYSTTQVEGINFIDDLSGKKTFKENKEETED